MAHHEWPSSPDASVSIHQVASLYDVTVKTARRWVAIGKIVQPEHEGRFSWRAGDVIEYRKAWRMVNINRKAARSVKKKRAKSGHPRSDSGQIGTSAPDGQKAPRRKNDSD